MLLTLKTDEQKQAYQELLQIIENCMQSVKIKGITHHQDEEGRYAKVALLCISLFKGEPTFAKINVEEPSSEKPFVGVTVYLDTFELNANNKADFIELVNLADEIIFYGEENNYFHMSFYVNDIWTE